MSKDFIIVHDTWLSRIVARIPLGVDIELVRSLFLGACAISGFVFVFQEIYAVIHYHLIDVFITDRGPYHEYHLKNDAHVMTGFRVAAVVGAVVGGLVGGGASILTTIKTRAGAKPSRRMTIMSVSAFILLFSFIFIPIFLFRVADPISLTFASLWTRFYLYLGLTAIRAEFLPNLAAFWHVFLALGLLGLAENSGNVIFNHLANTRSNIRAQNLANYVLTHQNAPESYGLFLRPFSSTRRISRHAGWLVKWSYVLDNLDDFEGFLTHSFRKAFGMPVIGLGRDGENVGIGRVSIRDEHWRMVVETLVEHAAFIVLIVSGREGTSWETKYLFSSRFLAKTILIAPARSLTYQNDHYDGHTDFEAARESFAQLGKSLPEWENGGVAFRYRNGDSKPHVVVKLGFDTQARDCTSRIAELAFSSVGNTAQSTQ